MARRNGQPGLGGIRIAVIGLAVLVAGLFIGSQLRGLDAFGFALLLGGALVVLFGVLRELSDRRK